MNPSILIIEDHWVLAKNIKTYLAKRGYDAVIAASGEEGLSQLASFSPDVILLDYHLPELNGLQVLSEIRRCSPRVKVVMLTGHGNVEIAVQAMKSGADDYLSKPVALCDLQTALEKVLKIDEDEEAFSCLLQREPEGGLMENIAGASPPMLQIKDMMRRLIEAECVLSDNSPPSVLITGETGTGKELVARALHFEGPRKDQPFIELNCSSIPPHLLEAELFGYERGAFTDAQKPKQGLIEASDGGTLFLDEVAELEMAAQAKLLKVIEDKKVRRLGSLRDRTINFRLIAATNQHLQRYVEEGRFRADLFYRLCTVHLELPPLRERGADILALANLFRDSHARRYGKPGLTFSPGAEQALMCWSWPGNVRELRNMLEQTVLLASSDVIEPLDLAFPKLQGGAGQGMPSRLSVSSGDLNVEKMERDFLQEALRKTNWNVTQASMLLGLSRDTLRYRMEKYGLKHTL